MKYEKEKKSHKQTEEPNDDKHDGVYILMLMQPHENNNFRLAKSEEPKSA